MPRFKYPRPVIHVVETLVEIDEKDDRDLPMALRAWNRRLENDDRKVDFEFRHDGMRFYEPTGYDADEIADLLRNPFAVLPELRELQLAQAERASGHENTTLPMGILSAIGNGGNIWSRFAWFYEKDRGRVEFPGNALIEIERAREAFENACRSMVVVDGHLWRECPEPMLAVDVAHRPGRITCVPRRLPTGPRDIAVNDRDGALEVLFSVTEFDAAIAMAKRFYDPDMPWRDYRHFSIDVGIDECFSEYPPIGDLASLLAHVASARPDRNGMLEKEVGEFLSHADNWTENSLADALHRALARIPEHERWNVPAVAPTLERLESRAISLEIDMVPRP